jgi:cobalt/nickel transport system permease protein
MVSLHTGALEIGTLDAISRRDSPAHRLDPRAKLLATIAFLAVVVSWGRYEILGLVPFAAFPLVLCAAGRVPFGFVAHKLLIAAPFVLVLGAFNPIFDTVPRELATGIEIPGGWISYLSILLRFGLTVGAALALVAVTGMNPVCAAAERLGAPRIFVAQLALLYRYLFVLAAQAQRMQRAAELRAPGWKRPSIALFGSLVGHLLLRTLDRAQRIHLAMRCRGFDGQIPLLRPMRFGPRDAVFLAAWIAFFAAVRFFDLSDIVGRFALGVWG